MVVRAGPGCPELAALLAGQDDTLTAVTGKLTARHIGQCEQCRPHLPGEIHPERLPALLPLASLPDGLREPVLQQAAGVSGRRSRVLGLLRRGGIRANPGAAVAVAAVLVWIVAALTATVITVSGRHTAHPTGGPPDQCAGRFRPRGWRHARHRPGIPVPVARTETPVRVRPGVSGCVGCARAT